MPRLLLAVLLAVGLLGAGAGVAPARAVSTGDARAAGPPAHYRFPIRGCRTSYARSHHDYPAADIFAAAGCRFVAPVSGVVDEVSRKDRWDPRSNRGATRGGLSVSVVGEDGVRYYGAHLRSIARGIRHGVHVRVGRVLGRVGQTGSARGTGTHLHFGISWPTPRGYWWIRRGVVAPQRFLDSWRAGGQASPVGAVRRARRAYGDPRICHVYC